MLGHSAAIIKRVSYIVSAMRDAAHQVVADLVVVERTRSGTTRSRSTGKHFEDRLRRTSSLFNAW